MTYIYAPIMGFIIALLNLLCPVLVLLLLPCIRWDKQASEGRDVDGTTGWIVRGDLPKWLSWFSTPDERLPGGMYEPTVKWWYLHFGRYACSYYWLGWRNCLMTFAIRVGKKTTDYIPEQPLGFWERDDIWRYAKVFTIGKLPPLKFVTGWQVYKTLDGSFQAAPVFTIKRF